MYYQVIIETNEKIKENENRKLFEFDKTDIVEIINDIIVPYKMKQEIHFDGYFLKYEDIIRISIKESSNTSKEIEKITQTIADLSEDDIKEMKYVIREKYIRK